MTEQITIAKLIENGTLTSEMAALLWQAVDEKVSFLTSAVYQNAGKTTLSKAILELRPPKMPLHYVAETIEVTEKLLQIEPKGGYLVVSEFSPADVPGYISGADYIRKIFGLLKKGYSLQGCIHAGGAEDAINGLQSENDLSDEDISKINLVLHIETFGTSFANLQRRLVDVFEIHYVENSRVFGHSIYSWNQGEDGFEYISKPHIFGRDTNALRKRRVILDGLVGAGKTSHDDVTDAVAAFYKGN